MTQKTDISYMRDLNIYESGQYMQLDVATRRNLELTETMRSKEKKGTMLWVLDKTRTAAGARMLRQWVELPLLRVSSIVERQSAVREPADLGLPQTQGAHWASSLSEGAIFQPKMFAETNILIQWKEAART